MPLLSAGAEPAKLGLCGTFLWVLPCSHEVKDHVSYHPLESTNHSFSSFDRWMLRSVPCSCRARHSLRTLDWETEDMGSCWSNNPADYWKINKHRMESRAAMRNNRRGWGLQDTDQALGEAESQTTWKASLHQAAPAIPLVWPLVPPCAPFRWLCLSSLHFKDPIFFFLRQIWLLNQSAWETSSWSKREKPKRALRMQRLEERVGKRNSKWL